jgi:hypothetical protein
MFTLNFSRILGLFLLLHTFKAKAAVTSLPTCTATTENDATTCNNSSGSSNLGVCITSSKDLYSSTTERCEKIELAVNTYYIFKDDSNGKYSKIEASTITSSDSLLIYSTNASSVLSQKTDFTYLSTADEKLITCASTGICTLQSTPGYYINDFSKSSENESPLIEVKSGGVAAAVDAKDKSVYFDSTSSKIIECTNKSTKVTCQAKDGTNGQIFVNAAVTSATENALISCKLQSGERKRATVTCGLTNGVNGYYLNSGPDHSTNPLIICSDSSCTAQKGTSGKYYLNAAVSGEVIECSTDTICQKKVVSEGDIFLNSGVTTSAKGIIQCKKDDQTAAITCSEVDSPSGYYLNTGMTKRSSPLIVCSTEKCEEKAGTSGTYYLNANEEGKVIECTSSSSCVNKVTVVNDIFVNSADTITDLMGAIIKCGAPTSTVPKIREMKKRATTTCSPADGIAGNYYINAGMNKKSKPLIVCANSKCEEQSGVAGAHYLNAVEEGKVIECTSSSSCGNKDAIHGDIFVNSVVTSETKEALILCEAESNTVKCKKIDGNTGGYYLNAGVNKRSQPLIICGSTASDGCKEQPGVTGTYYLNASSERTGEVIECTSSSSCSKKDVDVGEVYLNSATATKKSIIQCAEKTQANGGGGQKRRSEEITCSSAASDITGYFLNSGMNKKNKPLVVCTDEEGCEEKAGESGSHYINANTKGDDVTKVIECTSSSSCSNKDVAEGDVFLNNEVTSGLPEAIIQCSAPTTGGNGNRRSGETASAITCTPATTATIGYYLNAGVNKKNKPLIVCTDAKCEEKAGVTGAHYINANTEGKEVTKVIECTSNTSCSNKDVTETDIYLNSAVTTGVLDNAIIQCSKGVAGARRSNSGTTSQEEITCTAKTAVDKKYYLNAGINKKNKPLITCNSDGGCKEQAASTGAHYLNANESEEGKVIECTSPTACSNKEVEEADVYLNSGVTGKLADAIIQCTKEETKDRRSNDGSAAEVEIKCSAIPTATTGYYLNAGVNKKTKPLIICTEKDGCKEKVGVANAYYINAGITGKVIECSSPSACENKAAAEGDVYLNSDALGSLTNAIILCTKEETNARRRGNDGSTTEVEINCSAIQTATIGYYLNAGLNKSTKPLIICGDSKCEEKAGVANAHYLNAVKDDARVIECTDVTACSMKETVMDGDVFVNSAVTSALSEALIQCTAEEGDGTARKRKRSEGEKGTAVTVNCEKKEGKNLNIYINAGNKKQIIRCLSSGCEVADSDASSKNSSYYINVGGESKNLIKCTSNTCTIVTELPKDEVQTDYKVFLNANYMVGVDEENPLIKCSPSSSSSSNNNGAKRESEVIGISCLLASSKAASGKPEFYVNSDRDDSNKLYNDVLKTDIIKCEVNESATSCSTSSQTTKANDIFINANFDQNSMQIIKCTSDQGCYEAPAFPTEDSGESGENGENEGTKASRESGSSSSKIYYVNAGSVETDKLLDTLIECTSASEACVIKPADAENVYINANDNQLILCYATKGCIAKVTDASRDNNEFYINSIDTDKDLKEDMIKCSLSEDSTTKTCEMFNGDNEKVYINSFNSSQLIFCLTDTGCQLKDSAAVVDQPEYYVNGDDLDFGTEVAEDKKEARKTNDEEMNEEEAISDSAEAEDENDENDENTEQPTPAKDTFTARATDKRPFTGDLIECKANDAGIKCSIINGKFGEVYINSNYENDKTYPLIKCYETGCINVKVDEESLPHYYVNSGNKAKNKLSKAIIECVASDSACEVVEAEANEIFINSNENETDKQIIKCTKNNCSSVASGASETNDEYYIDSGKAGEDVSYEHNIIKCSIDNEDDGGNNSRSIEISESEAILSKRESIKVICERLSKDKIGVGIYMNSNYSESGDRNQLIQCSSENGCKAISISESGMGYYVNAESTDLNNAIIYCSSKKCEKQTPENTNMFFVGKDSGNPDGLIECVGPKSVEEEPKEGNPDTKENKKETESKKRSADETATSKCTLKPAFNSEGYYLNSGYNKSMNQTIQCDFTEGCRTVKVDLGYYVNAGNPKKPVIKCEEEKSECKEEEAKECPDSSKVKAGNYCYEDNQLKFFTASNTTAIAVSKSDYIYAFATIPEYGFPGIKREMGSLFKISRYFITRFYQGGVILIDKNGKLVDSLGGDMSDIHIYDCNEKTKVCTERPGCTSNTYMFDSENSRALFCNDGILEYTQFTGYVVDGNRFESGNKHSYLIYCENGKNCTSFKPKIASYYLNSGYDANTNTLIRCSGNDCVTVTSEVGYYVAHNDAAKNGVIRCVTEKSCVYNQVNGKVKYLNAGYDKVNNGIIDCKEGKCKVARANKGYYLTYTSTRLIYCQSSTSCSEITPNVNFYPNADTSDSTSTIINCIQASTTVTCSAESSKIGFYTTVESNVLIRCREDESCETVIVQDGIFKGAIEDLTAPEKRSENVQNIQEHDFEDGDVNKNVDGDAEVDEDLNDNNDNLEKKKKENENENESENENENENEKMVIEKDNDEKEIEKMVDLEDIVKDENAKKDLVEKDEDGKMLNLNDRGNAEEAYGIIRCRSGKCSALTANELSAIPVCEFNHNKCYITLDYAKKKLATTTLTAGNICTNNNRSVFYFATDTIVVKPDVISGVISTYVYTTTNTNCVEVNDSYNDMFFTVGSTIYTLSQGSVLQFAETGYYFINVATNTIVKSKDINEYNDENVKLYRCDGNKCHIVDKQNSVTYFADVNKRILRYDIVNDVYSFAYEKEIRCIFADGKCTPNADLNNREFCITYKGEIVLASTNIKNRETGECYRARNINSNIYGYSKNLYKMNMFAAKIVHQTGFYIISRITNTTVSAKDFTRKKINIVMYGCTQTNCRLYEPEEDTYYYDAQAKNILKYKNGVWSPPKHSGYAYIAMDPSKTYIYRFTKKGDEITIQGKANYGYYYTVDNEMYHCDRKYGECYPIEETGYYFTNSGEIFYCIYDSEGLEPTECIRKNCVSGEYYYINDNYYRCDINSGILVPVASRYCYYNGYVIMNFPLALTEEFPYNVKQAINNIQKNNNSTAIVKRRRRNDLEVVSGIFTNCTYDVEETKTNFDLVCINNYVVVDKETNDMKICNIEQFGYVDCVEDDENPSKCNVSAAYPLLKPSIFTFFILLFITAIFHF